MSLLLWTLRATSHLDSDVTQRGVIPIVRVTEQAENGCSVDVRMPVVLFSLVQSSHGGCPALSPAVEMVNVLVQW